MGWMRRTAGMTTRRALAGVVALVGVCCAPAHALEGDIVQGTLQLRWGDARAAPSGHPATPPALEAWLDLGPGLRYRLDEVEALRAAGDLAALSNRRVAVSYVPRKRVSSDPVIEAIVPVGRLPQRATVREAGGRIAMAAPVTGGTRWVTLMCKFADIAVEPKSRAFFQAQYGDAPGQLGHYWSEVSYGAIHLAGSAAYGWYTLPAARADYVPSIAGKPRADLSRLFNDCVAQAEADVDFRSVQGINLVFNGELDGRAWGGGACGLLEGVDACTRATWSPPWAADNVARLAHEMGHGYGLPHSDNSDGDADTHDNPWDLMSDAWRHATTDPVLGLLPKHLSMHQRDRLGWLPPARKRLVPFDNEAIHEIVLDAGSVAGSDQVQLAVLGGEAQPDPYRTVSYTLEARRRTGTYESALAGDAVIIHRVAGNGAAYSVDTDTPPADLSGNEGSMLKVGEHWNTPDGRHWVSVIASTPTGFRVRIGPRPRVMSTPAPMLERSLPASSAHPLHTGQTDAGALPGSPPRRALVCGLPARRWQASPACAPFER